MNASATTPTPPTTAEIAIKILDIAKLSKHQSQDSIGAHILIVENAVTAINNRIAALPDLSKLSDSMSALSDVVAAIKANQDEINTKLDALTTTLNTESGQVLDIDEFVKRVSNAANPPAAQ